MRRFFMVCAALLMSGAAAFGYTNVLENGTNQTITTGWDAEGDMTVGDDTSSNALYIVGGGSLTNVNAYVGASSNAFSNTATVSDPNAEWINTGTLQIGAAGNSNNTVSVSNGGTIFADDLVIHAGNDFNLNNNGTLALTNGFDVSVDGFNWNSGGTLSVGGALMGMATTNEGTILSGEKTLVLDGGFMSTETNLIVGYESSDNAFAITNGATVGNANGYIGWGSNSVNNAVLVSDAGSAWTNNGNLYVGVYGDSTNLMTAGTGNSLTATNEAWVFVGGLDTTLTNMGSGGITVAGGAEMVVGESASVLADGVYIDAAGAFNLDGTLRVTGDFDAGQAGFYWRDGSTLTVNRKLTLNDGLGGTNKTLNVDGGSWDRGGDLQINGTGNTLAIRNGGGLTNAAAYVVGSNNTVVVSGSGSHWLNNGALNITNSGNSVTVDSGGRVTADSLKVTDGNDFNLNNRGTLAMTGDFDLSGQSNLNWNAGGNLSVGGLLEGMAAETNLPTADAEYLGGSRGLTLEGNGRWLADDNNLIVGLNDDLNRLSITNGGSVDNADGYIGWGESGDQNDVTVSAGGAWTNHGGGLYVGTWVDANTNLVDAGQDNSLTVQSNGWVFVGEGRTNGPGGGLVVASTNGAELVVGGKGSSVTVEQSLYVGVDAASTGTVSVASGGSISVGELVINANSTFDLSGTLSVGNDFNAGQDGFTWNDGSTLSVGGDLTGLNTLHGTNLTLVIDGGTWDTAATNLYITGTGNTVSITNGTQAYSASAYIGVTSNDVDNTVLVGGSGSVWNIAENLFINSSNTLELASTGLVSIAGNMNVSNATVAGAGTVLFGTNDNVFSVYGTNSQISFDVLFDGGDGADAVAITESELFVEGSLSNRFVGFEKLSMTNSLLGGSGVVDAFTDINLSGGWIAPGGELVIEGAFAASDTILRVTAGADSLRVTNTNQFDLLTMGAEVTISNDAVAAAFTNMILTVGGRVTNEFATVEYDEHFLLYDFNMLYGSNSVSVASEAKQDGEISATLTYGGIQGIRAGFNGMQNSIFVRTKQLRRNAVATDHAISNEAYLISPTNAPSGPQGPGDKNTIFGMHFWAEQFSGQGDYDTMGLSEGFSLNNNGTTFGLDRLFGDSLVAGVNYTYARSAARAVGGDRVDTETYWLGLYGEWFGKNDCYLEGLIGLGWSDYSAVRTDVGYEGVGSFEGSDLGGHIEAGKYIHRNNWAMAPYAGLHYLGIQSDSYTETHQAGGPPVKVSDQSVASLESALGVKLRNRFDTRVGRFQTVGYAEWVYDFINDDIGSTLSDGTISVGTARITPGASLLNAGVGLSWICTDYLDIGVGYDGRFNENYEEHMGTIMLDVRF